MGIGGTRGRRVVEVVLYIYIVIILIAVIDEAEFCGLGSGIQLQERQKKKKKDRRNYHESEGRQIHSPKSGKASIPLPFPAFDFSPSSLVVGEESPANKSASSPDWLPREETYME